MKLLSGKPECEGAFLHPVRENMVATEDLEAAACRDQDGVETDCVF